MVGTYVRGLNEVQKRIELGLRHEATLQSGNDVFVTQASKRWTLTIEVTLPGGEQLTYVMSVTRLWTKNIALQLS